MPICGAHGSGDPWLLLLRKKTQGMVELESAIWVVAATVVGTATGKPLGSFAKDKIMDGWSQKGKDSVSIALYMGALYGIVYGMSTAAYDLSHAILSALLGGLSLGLGLSIRHIVQDIMGSLSSSDPDAHDDEPEGSESQEGDSGRG